MKNRKSLEERRLQKEYDARISFHHIINKSSKELFNNLNDEENLKERTRWPHRKFHEAHGNEHPLETLQKTKRFMQVMSKEAKELYKALISMNEKDFYKEKFVKWNQ